METLLTALRAVAEATRLRLIALCAEGELTVSELTHILGQSQPRVSRHLKLLCDAGLLERFREGTNAFYRVADADPGGALARKIIDALPADDPVLSLDRARLAGIRRERAEAATAYFRKNAAMWDEIRSLYVDEREVERALLDMVRPHGAEALLDIGTGTGRILELFAGSVRRAVGIDLSREMLSVARANLERAEGANVSIRQGNMYQLPWPEASFDLVTVHQVLHYAEHPAEAITEAARVLRPGGQLVIVDFAPHALDHLRTQHAHRRLGLSDKEVQAWCRSAGLTVRGSKRLPGDPLTVCLWSATSQAAREAA